MIKNFDLLIKQDLTRYDRLEGSKVFTSKIEFWDQIWTKGGYYQAGFRSRKFLKSVHPNWTYGQKTDFGG